MWIFSGIAQYNKDYVNLHHMVQIEDSISKVGKLCNDIDVGSIAGKQLNLCKGNIIFCHVDCFCLQERKKRKMKSEVFCVSNTSATASAMRNLLLQNF